MCNHLYLRLEFQGIQITTHDRVITRKIFPHYWPFVNGYNAFTIVSPNKLINKQSIGGWTEVSWRSCEVTVMITEVFYEPARQVYYPMLSLTPLHNALCCIMTSSSGNIFRVTAPLWEESTGRFLSQGPVTRSFDICLTCAWKYGRTNSRDSCSWWRHCNGIMRKPTDRYWIIHTAGKFYRF